MRSTVQSGCIEELLGERARRAGIGCPCSRCGGDLPVDREIAREASRMSSPFVDRRQPRYGSVDAKMAAAGDK